MAANAVIPYQDQIAAAEARGDRGEMQRFYQLQQGTEIADVRTPAPVTRTESARGITAPSLPAGVDAAAVMDSFREIQPDLTSDLEARWAQNGTSAAAELPFASWFINRVVPAHMQHEPISIEGVEWAARLGRWHYGETDPQLRNDGTATRPAGRHSMSTRIEGYNDEVAAIREEIRKAQASRQPSHIINKLYADEQRLLERLHPDETGPDQPIVGMAGRTA